MADTPHASDLIKDLSNVPNIIGGLGLSIAAAQKAFDVEYLDSIERILAMIKILLGGKADGGDTGTDLNDDQKEKLGATAPFIQDMLMKLAPSRYQFTETTLSVKLDLAQSMQAAGSVGLGLGFGAVTVNAAFSIGYSYDYRGAAECRTVIHAYPADQSTFNSLLKRAEKLSESTLTLPPRTPVDQAMFDKNAAVLDKLTGIKARELKKPE
ncbi:MAG TPA: hypothetical protein VF297_02370 [Pyrinomonadaceae bacterium]